jgi:hypothetical protein
MSEQAAVRAYLSSVSPSPACGRRWPTGRMRVSGHCNYTLTRPLAFAKPELRCGQVRSVRFGGARSGTFSRGRRRMRVSLCRCFHRSLKPDKGDERCCLPFNRSCRGWTNTLIRPIGHLLPQAGEGEMMQAGSRSKHLGDFICNGRPQVGGKRSRATLVSSLYITGLLTDQFPSPLRDLAGRGSRRDSRAKPCPCGG